MLFSINAILNKHLWYIV